MIDNNSAITCIYLCLSHYTQLDYSYLIYTHCIMFVITHNTLHYIRLIYSTLIILVNILVLVHL